MSGVEVILDRISSEYLGIDHNTVRTYRQVFDTPEGREVLADLLAIMGFYSTSVDSIEESMLQNVGKLILAKCGAWHAQQIRSITEAIMELPQVVPEYKVKE